jgi:hypothetical protein
LSSVTRILGPMKNSWVLIFWRGVLANAGMYGYKIGGVTKGIRKRTPFDL